MTLHSVWLQQSSTSHASDPASNVARMERWAHGVLLLWRPSTGKGGLEAVTCWYVELAIARHSRDHVDGRRAPA